MGCDRERRYWSVRNENAEVAQVGGKGFVGERIIPRNLLRIDYLKARSLFFYDIKVAILWGLGKACERSQIKNSWDFELPGIREYKMRIMLFLPNGTCLKKIELINTLIYL